MNKKFSTNNNKNFKNSKSKWNRKISNIRNNGYDIKFNNNYILWCHNIYNKNWNHNSYKKLYQFNNVSGFWKLFNNFSKLGMIINHYYIMKDNSMPYWEHHTNRNGCVCSFKLDFQDSLKLWEELTISMLTNDLVDDKYINGLSFSPKNEWAIIKIWINTDYDISNEIKNCISNYDNLSILYKKNEPEY